MRLDFCTRCGRTEADGAALLKQVRRNVPGYLEFGITRTARRITAKAIRCFGKAGQMKAAIAALGLAIAVSACGREIGHKFDGSAAQLLPPGTTTVEDAVARFGPPSVRSRHANGETIVRWRYLKDTPLGPESASLEIMFNSDDRMIRIVKQEEHGPGDDHWYY